MEHERQGRVNNDLLLRFKEHLAVLNRTPDTIADYAGGVRPYLAVLAKDIKAVTRADMEGYIAGLYDYRSAGKPYATNTIIVKVRALKRFFEFLERANIIFINPMEYIHEPRKALSLPRNILTEQEVAAIFEQPDLATLTGIRDRAILELFYATGLRLGELCRLAIYDVDLADKMLRIKCGKGQKDRVVPMGRHAVRFLEAYITKSRPGLTSKEMGSRALFVTRRGMPLSKVTVGLMIGNYAKAANIEKRVSAHTFRHTFASLLIKNGADITAVQKMLGHAFIDTTQGYLRALGVDVKRVHSESHPREKDPLDLMDQATPQLIRIRPRHG